MSLLDRFFAFCYHFDRYRCDVSERCFKEEYSLLRKQQKINLLHLSLLYPSLKTKKRIVMHFIQFWVYIAILIFHIGVVFMTLIKCEAKDFLVVVNTTHVGFILLLDLLFIFQSNFVRHSFCFAHKILGSGFYTYEDEEVTEEELVLKEKYRKIKETLELRLPTLNVTAGFTVLIVTPVTEAIFNTEENRAYTDSGIFLHLPVPAYYPFDMSKIENIIMALLGQVCCVFVLISILTTAVYAYFGATTHVTVQLKRLLLSIENLEQRAFILYNKKKGIIGAKFTDDYFSNPEFLKVMESCFNKNVQHLQIIKRFIREINIYVRRPIFSTFMAGGVILAMSAFVVLTGWEKPGMVVGTVLVALAEFICITYICLHGQMISNLNDDLRFMVYNVQWFKCSKRLKSSLVMVQIMACQDMYIDAMFSTKTNMETYSNILNTAYSYFSLLIAFR